MQLPVSGVSAVLDDDDEVKVAIIGKRKREEEEVIDSSGPVPLRLDCMQPRHLVA
jgi:hypothetical protein